MQTMFRSHLEWDADATHLRARIIHHTTRDNLLLAFLLALSWLFFSFLLVNLSDQNHPAPLAELLVCAILHGTLLLGLGWLATGRQEFMVEGGELVQSLTLFGLCWTRRAQLAHIAELEICACSGYEELGENDYVQIEFQCGSKRRKLGSELPLAQAREVVQRLRHYLPQQQLRQAA
ncbi:hypothetical protein V8J88_15930 [Massilia sp. W12]|uniref:hypothetical protein n=1 Tax=Massilia sp. W12 TaxID=3126507 RepID=UPI0030CFFCCD